MSKKLIKMVLAVVVFTVIFSQITLFIVQPIGAVPTGRTLVILRLNKTNFIDSADAMCIREMGNLNLLCRGIMMATVVNKSKILLKLPYSSFLYNISTGGKDYK